MYEDYIYAKVEPFDKWYDVGIGNYSNKAIIWLISTKY